MYIFIQVSQFFFFSEQCCFEVLLVTRIKKGKLANALIMPLADGHTWVKRFGSGSRCRISFPIVVTVRFVPEKSSNSFHLAKRTVSQCFMVDHWSSFASKCVFMFAVGVSCFVKTAFLDSPCFLRWGLQLTGKQLSFYLVEWRVRASRWKFGLGAQGCPSVWLL